MSVRAAAATTPAKALSILAIQRRVAMHFGLPYEAMTSPCRRRSMARPRQIAMFLCREMTPRSLPEIGHRFGRDHTTILHAVRHIAALIEADPDFAAEVAALREAAKKAA